MDISQNRRPSQAAPASTGQRPATPSESHRAEKSPRGWFGRKSTKITLLVIAVLVLAGIVWCVLQSPTLRINRGEYQAVFLTNGQVYFGKLSGLTGGYATLKDVYYLQSNDTSSSVQDSTSKDQKAPTSDSDMKLVKLGSEIHGPEDQMEIARDQILFWENMKNNSKVTTAIDGFKKDQAKQ